MIPFDGLFAQNYVYPFALGAYDATKPPAGYVAGNTAFAIMADAAKARAALTIAQTPHRELNRGSPKSSTIS